MSNLNTNLNKNTDSITANLSRPTTHDASLTTGSLPVTTNLNQGLTGFTSNLNQGLTGFTSNLNTGTASNLLPETINTTLRQEEFVSGGFGQVQGVGTAGQMRTDQNLKNTNANFTNTLTGANVGTDYHRGIETTGLQDSKFNPTFQTEIPKAGMTNSTMQMPIQENVMADEQEPEKKKGFISKLTSHIPFIGHKNKTDKTDMTDTQAVNYQEPSGILDEKGTTVGVPGNFAQTSHLGLPVTGPDYTHGTHGLTHDTVFTGGAGTLGTNLVSNTSIPMGGNANMGSQMLNNNNLVGNNVTGPTMGMGMEKASFGLDYSGTNATHVNRDITLQEGGLLGLRQGAVTGTPGDIITNLDNTSKANRMDQGMTNANMGTNMGTTSYVGTTTTQPRNLSGDTYFTK